MAAEPSVCAVLLTADRPEMTRQAIRAFQAQTYENKQMIVWDSSDNWGRSSGSGNPELSYYDPNVIGMAASAVGRGKTIGELRNQANRMAGGNPVLYLRPAEIIIHWDSDDWSHPNRIAEQVQLLQSSGADVVGYREMLFWRECRDEAIDASSFDSNFEVLEHHHFPGEAWLYSCPNPNYALGTSLCYRREVWERKPFEATSMGEDEKFMRGLKVQSVSSLTCGSPAVAFGQGGPAMIARIHAGNTSTAYDPRKMERAAEWRRAPEWDKYCRGVMA